MFSSSASSSTRQNVIRPITRPSPSRVLTAPEGPSSTADHGEKRRRSREGCFQCRRKKRGCDQARPRCGACTRTDIECTFPPRKWDNNLGRLITIKQPNQRRKSRGTSFSAPEPAPGMMAKSRSSPHPIPPPGHTYSEHGDAQQDQAQPYFPIDPALTSEEWHPGAHDAAFGLDSIPDVPFSFFADFFNLDATLFETTDHLLEADSDLRDYTLGPGTQPSSTDSIFPTATGGGGTDAAASSSTMTVDVPVRSDMHAESHAARQKDVDHRATMEELRAFWEELLQGYISSTNDYYYSCSPSDRRLILETIVGASMTDVHLAASAYDCAAHRALILQQAGRSAKAAEWAGRSRSFCHAARHMLADDSTPLIARVGASNDLRLGHIWHDEAMAAKDVLLACSAFIHAALGPRPTFTITSDVGTASISLTTFIFSDVFDCIANKGRRTTFEIKVDPPTPAGPMGLRVHLGVPAEILWCFAEAVNLAAERESRSTGRGGISEERVRQRADEVERALNGWTPVLRPGLSSGELMEVVATQTMWREAARIFLYSTVYSLGILSTKIRSALEEFIRASDTLPDTDLTLPPERAGPTAPHVGTHDPILFSQAGRAPAWFIAAMCAITPDERSVCMMGLRSCGHERVYRDNADVVRDVWEETDRSGKEVDWREWIREKGACVVFL